MLLCFFETKIQFTISMGGEKAIGKIQICYRACIPEELDDFKMVFLTPFSVCLWNKQVIAVSIVKLEIHQMKKIKGEMRKISNPSCSSFPCHFSFFLPRISSGWTFPSRQSLFSHNQLTLEIFPLRSSCFLIFFCMSQWDKEQLRNTQLE